MARGRPRMAGMFPLTPDRPLPGGCGLARGSRLETACAAVKKPRGSTFRNAVAPGRTGRSSLAFACLQRVSDRPMPMLLEDTADPRRVAQVRKSGGRTEQHLVNAQIRRTRSLGTPH